jgi:hypothetical protein
VLTAVALKGANHALRAGRFSFNYLAGPTFNSHRFDCGVHFHHGRQRGCSCRAGAVACVRVCTAGVHTAYGPGVCRPDCCSSPLKSTIAIVLLRFMARASAAVPAGPRKLSGDAPRARPFPYRVPPARARARAREGRIGSRARALRARAHRAG